MKLIWDVGLPLVGGHYCEDMEESLSPGQEYKVAVEVMNMGIAPIFDVVGIIKHSDGTEDLVFYEPIMVLNVTEDEITTKAGSVPGYEVLTVSLRKAPIPIRRTVSCKVEVKSTSD